MTGESTTAEPTEVSAAPGPEAAEGTSGAETGTRQLALLTAGQLLIGVGYWAALVAAQARATYGLGSQALFLGLLGLAWGLPSALTSRFVGNAIGSRGPRIVGVISCLVSAAASLALCVRNTEGWLLGLTLVCGLGRAFAQPAIDAMPAHLLHRVSDARASVWLGFAANVPVVAGPAVAAAATAGGGPGLAFLVNAVACVAASVVLLTLRTRAPEETAGEAAAAGAANNRRGLHRFGQLDATTAVLGLTLIVWISYGCYSVLELLYIKEVLKASVSTFALTQGLYGVGLITTSLVLTRAESLLSLRNVLAVTVLAVAVSEVLYVATASLTVCIIGSFLWGCGASLFGPACRVALLRGTPPEQHGTAMARWRATQATGSLAPPIVAGFFADAVGVQAVMIGSSVLVAAVGVLAFVDPVRRHLNAGTSSRRKA
ncbi:MFS transporter [Streptomyces sp. NPDC002536]